jgi:hypothetical protein
VNLKLCLILMEFEVFFYEVYDKPKRIPECSYYWLPGTVGAKK